VPLSDFPPHLSKASSGVIKSIFSRVGSLAEILSGVFAASSPVLVIILISGNSFGVEVRMSSVPFDIYKFSNIVHPGACERKVVCGNSCPFISRSAVLSVAGVGRAVVVVVTVRVVVSAKCS